MAAMTETKSTPSGWRKGLTRNVIILGFVSLLNDGASEMIYPLLPVFLTAVLGAGPAALGIIEGIAESTASLLKLYFRLPLGPGQAAQGLDRCGVFHFERDPAAHCHCQPPGPRCWRSVSPTGWARGFAHRRETRSSLIQRRPSSGVWPTGFTGPWTTAAQS